MEDTQDLSSVWQSCRKMSSAGSVACNPSQEDRMYFAGRWVRFEPRWMTSAGPVSNVWRKPVRLSGTRWMATIGYIVSSKWSTRGG